MATTAKKITSAKWAPELGIPGNSKGVFTFVSTVPLTVYNSATGLETQYPAGTNKISVNRTPEPGKTINQAFAFSYQGKVIYIYSIKLESSPLVYARWTPKNPYSSSSLIKSSEGTLNLKWVGVQQLAIPQLGIPTMTLPAGNSQSIPFNLPTEVTKIVRGDLKTYAELFLNATLTADGKQKPVRIKAIFG
jgi:hypothetical protein